MSLKSLSNSSIQLQVLTPEKHGDERGFFSETYSRTALEAIGFHQEFVQDNLSLSHQKGVVRGLHFQSPPCAQAKLVSVLQGRILDIAVDIRRGSPTYGQYAAYELSASNWCQLLVPVGFAHGFCTLEPDCLITYKVTKAYSPDFDHGLLWNDAELNIEWPVAADEAILSDRDRQQPLFRDLDSPFIYES